MQDSFMQTDWWEKFKSRQGWEGQRFLDLLVLKKKVQLGKSFCYIPEVTLGDDHLPAVVAKATGALKQAADPSTIFGRIELLVPYTDKAHQQLLRAGLIKPKDEVQPEWRQEIDLNLLSKEILGQMKPKGRYNIGVAKRHGVEVKYDVSEASIHDFTQIFAATKLRQKFAGRSAGYLQELILLLDQGKVGGLWVARLAGEILAGAVVVMFKGRASYLYGASASVHREVMAPHLLHFNIMEEAKRRGCAVYDLIGVAPPEASPKHPWAGISRFKREFGGTTVHYLGSYDRVYNQMWYKAYQILRK